MNAKLSSNLDYETGLVQSEFDIDFYLQQVPGLRGSSINPIAHYLENGWRELLDPSPSFSTSYYLHTYPDVREKDINPLVHYLESGRVEGRVKHPNDRVREVDTRFMYERGLVSADFDSAYYLRQLPKLDPDEIDPIIHYLEQGWRELRDPSQAFSTSYYLETYPDVREAGINPLLHFVESGRREGRSTRPSEPTQLEIAPYAQEHLVPKEETKTAEAVLNRELEKASNGGTSTKFRLPPVLIDCLKDTRYFDLEFYRRKYNVAGSEIEVFTDFLENPTRAASPYFDPLWYVGQYPQVPHEGFSPLLHYVTEGFRLGFRPSRIFNGVEVDIPQDEIAKIINDSGLFDSKWYSHTNGDVVRAGADPLKHYSRVGANEYKRSPNVLFDNTFYVSRAKDVREYKWHPLVHYILVGGHKRLATHALVDVAWLKKIHGWADSPLKYFAGMTSSPPIESVGPNEYFDPQYYLSRHPEAAGYPGGSIGHFLDVGWKKGFDPSDRFSTTAYGDANPDVMERGANPFLHFIINGREEGRNPKPPPSSIPTTLDRFSEPEYGGSGPILQYDADVYLPENFSLSIAVHLHLYYTEMADEFSRYLSNIPVPFHLFVSVPPGRGDTKRIAKQFSAGIDNCNGVTVASPENRGRDVAPFLVEFGRQLLSYDLVLHLHSKKSPHSVKHADWRRFLLHYTVGNKATVTQILTAFQADPTIGVFQPPYHPQVRAQPKWGGNRELVSEILPRFGYSYAGESCPHFPAGSFFWARTDALRPLLDGRIRLEDFDQEANQIDSTLAHALERLFGLIPILRGYSVVSRFIDVAHNLVHYYGKSRRFREFERDRTSDILGYQLAVRNRRDKRGRIAVVTAIMGPFDALLIPYYLESDIDYFCVTDSIRDGYGVYRLIDPPLLESDSRRTARYVKTNLLRMFPGYDFVVWVDGNILVRSPISQFVNATEASGCAVGAIPHPTRRSYLEEAEVAIKMKLDEPGLIREQMKAYSDVEGLDSANLIETNFMVFDSRKPEAKEFTRLWWNEINTYSRRDQLSINYCLLKASASWVALLPDYCSVRDSQSFSLFRHGLNNWGPKPHIYSEWYIPNSFDGHLLPLPDIHRWSKMGDRLDLDVVVCVHNALDDVKACLESVANSLRGRGKIIIVDDASDEETAQYLDHFATDNAAQLVRLNICSGYTKAANAGIRAGVQRNVLLLNSDTVVPPGALEKLSDALDRDPLLAIVGPLSNAASHQSVPETAGSGSQTAVNAMPASMGVNDMDLFLERRWNGRVTRTPLVHGFCFCVKRCVFDEIGVFDEINFPRGYGEENDFCFRATDAGYGLGILTNTFVYHAKSKSYSPGDRTNLMNDGMAALIRKVTKPRIMRAVEAMADQPDLTSARKAVARLFEPNFVRHKPNGRIFLMPSLRSDGLPAGSGYVRLLLPYKAESLALAYEITELRTAKLPPLEHTDTVVVQRDGGAIDSASLIAWIDAVKHAGARLVYEIDDDLLDGAALKSRGFKGDVSDLAKRVMAFARSASIVTVSSEALRTKFSLINGNTILVPNALDKELWGLQGEEGSVGINSMNSRSDNKVIIGYVGTPTHDHDLAIVKEAIDELNVMLPGRIDVQIIGGFGQKKNSFGNVISLPMANDYPSFVRWLRAHVRWDIGVIPLAGNSFNSNKSYLKFLECGALGMAVVCSDGPEYSKVVRNGETGLLVKNTKEDWINALSTLVRNKDERMRLARACFKDVLQNHTIENLTPNLLRAVSTIGQQ